MVRAVNTLKVANMSLMLKNTTLPMLKKKLCKSNMRSHQKDTWCYDLRYEKVVRKNSRYFKYEK